MFTVANDNKRARRGRVEWFLASAPPAALASLAYRLSSNATCSPSVPRDRCGAYGRVVTLYEVAAGGDRAASGAGGAAGAGSSRPFSWPPHAVVVPPRFCVEELDRKGSQRAARGRIVGRFCDPLTGLFPFSRVSLFAVEVGCRTGACASTVIIRFRRGAPHHQAACTAARAGWQRFPCSTPHASFRESLLSRFPPAGFPLPVPPPLLLSKAATGLYRVSVPVHPLFMPPVLYVQPYLSPIHNCSSLHRH